MSRGYLVAVCGIDGSGKSTVIQALAEAFDEPVVLTRQPTDLYRQDPLVRAVLDGAAADVLVLKELALLAAFDRLRHLRTVVLPALAEGRVVVSDRYVYSTYAYFLARGLADLDWLRGVNDAVPTPDLTVYLDLDPVVAVDRILARDGSSRKREELDVERMTKVREHFRTAPWGVDDRYRRVDASRDRDDVVREVVELVRAGDPR